MPKTQKELLQPLFNSLGLEDSVLAGLFPADGVEPALNVDTVLQRAQEYSKPFLKDHFKTVLKDDFEKELQPAFKGKYINDALGKIAKASNGLITRADVEGKSIEEAVALFTEKLTGAAGKTDKEKDDMITALNEKLKDTETEWQGKLDQVNNDWNAKEAQRSVVANFNKKILAIADKLTIDPNSVAEAIYPHINAKYHLKAEGEDVVPFDKADPTKRVKKSETAFATIDEDIEAYIDKFKWRKESNGGAAGGAAGAGAGGQQRPPHLPGGAAPGKADSPIVAAAREAGLIPAQT
jgi:hypothetical protein